MAEDDLAKEVTGCCVIYDPNAPDGKLKYDNFTEKACSDAAGRFSLPYHFHPNTSCGYV